MYFKKTVAKWHCKPVIIFNIQMYLLGNYLYFQLFWKWLENFNIGIKRFSSYIKLYWGEMCFMKMLNEILNGHLLPRIQEALPQTLWKGGLFHPFMAIPETKHSFPILFKSTEGVVHWLARAFNAFWTLAKTALKD